MLLFIIGRNNLILYIMNEYIVAIPTYNRYEEINTKTLSTLKKGGVPKNRIYVFVDNKEEEKKYKESMDKNTYFKIVVAGTSGITNLRVFICIFFPSGVKIVSLDDDIERVEKLTRDGKLSVKRDLHSFFKKSFNDLKKHGLYIWGVYPVRNSFYMKNSIQTGLRFIIGALYGYINRHDSSLYPKKIKDGGVLRYNNITIKTKFYAKGGIGPEIEKRKKSNEDAVKYLISKYPNLVSKFRRGDGRIEVKLKAVK